MVIKVEGMVCGGCSSRVQEALDKDPLIAKATVSLDKGEAVVELKGVSGERRGWCGWPYSRLLKRAVTV